MSTVLEEVVADEQIGTITIDKLSNDGDHDKYQHYFSKKDISENLLTGKPMQALCGKIVKQQVDPHGRTVCPTCIDWIENVVGMNRPPEDRD